jgi:hypothetical protein
MRQRAHHRQCAFRAKIDLETRIGLLSPVHNYCRFPTNTYRGAASFRQGLDQFALIMKSIDVIRLVVDGEHCVAIVNIDTVFGLIPFAEHIHVSNGEIVSIRGYCDPRPMLSGANTSA